MSIQRYAVLETALCIGGNLHDGEVLMVRADAHDREMAALLEELARFDEGMRALACSLGAGGYNAETMTADQLVGKVQWGIDNIITVQERRLTAAEQRNAVLTDGAQEALTELTIMKKEIGFRAHTLTVIEKLAAALKPTESGASE